MTTCCIFKYAHFCMRFFHFLHQDTFISAELLDKHDTFVSLKPRTETCNIFKTNFNFDRHNSNFEARNYVIGYIGNKLGLKQKQNVNDKSWITLKGKGKLFEPTDELKGICETCDFMFDVYNGNGLRICQNPMRKVVQFIMRENPTFPPKVVHRLV